MSLLAVVVLAVMFLTDKTVLTMADLDAVDSEFSSLLVFAQDDGAAADEDGAGGEASTTS